MPPGHLPREHPVIYVSDDKPAQHEEQVDRQIAFVHRPGVTVGVNRRKMPAIMEEDDPNCGDAAQRCQRRQMLRRGVLPHRSRVAGFARTGSNATRQPICRKSVSPHPGHNSTTADCVPCRRRLWGHRYVVV